MDGLSGGLGAPHRESPARRWPGGVLVEGGAAWWSVWRRVLGDRGAGGGFIDDGLGGGVGGEQGGDGEPVDGAGQAAGVAVDGADRVVGEQGVGPPGQRQVTAEAPAGTGGGQGACGG